MGDRPDGIMRLPTGRLGYGTSGILQLGWKLAVAERVETQSPDKGSGVGELSGGMCLWVEIRVYNADGESQPIPHHPYGQRQIGVVGYYNGLLVISIDTVHQEIGSQVDVGPFLFRVPDLYRAGMPRNGCYQWSENSAGPKLSVVYGELRNSLESSKVHSLSNRALWVSCAGLNQGGEIPDPVNLVNRSQRLAE